MNKTELITDILNLYDEVEGLRNQVISLKTARGGLCNVEHEPTISFIDKKMIEFGKKEAFRKSIYSWNVVNVHYDDEAEQFIATSFDNWLKNKIIKDRIPSFMSFDEFLNYFNTDLKDLYEKEKAEELADKKEEEDE